MESKGKRKEETKRSWLEIKEIRRHKGEKQKVMRRKRQQSREGVARRGRELGWRGEERERKR